MEKIFVNSREQLDDLYDDSAFTFEGMTTDDANLNAIHDFINQYTKFDGPAYIITGKFMNDEYGLTGSNAYPDDLTIVSLMLSDMENVDAIIMPKMRVGARWFDDIVDNNARREGRE